MDFMRWFHLQFHNTCDSFEFVCYLQFLSKTHQEPTRPNVFNALHKSSPSHSFLMRLFVKDFTIPLADCSLQFAHFQSYCSLLKQTTVDGLLNAVHCNCSVSSAKCTITSFDIIVWNDITIFCVNPLSQFSSLLSFVCWLFCCRCSFMAFDFVYLKCIYALKLNNECNARPGPTYQCEVSHLISADFILCLSPSLSLCRCFSLTLSLSPSLSSRFIQHREQNINDSDWI